MSEVFDHTPKFKEYRNPDGTSLFLFWCPGCRCIHPYNVPRWTFNGNYERPSFTPSLRVLDGQHGTQCHLYVTDGTLNFCSDCPHEYAGRQGVEMCDIPADY